jgi:hypothetical protein
LERSVFLKESTLKKISYKGVVIGSVTDIVTTNILAIPFVVYVMTTRHLGTLPKDQIAGALTQVLQNDPVLFSTQLLIGAICSVLGGYVAARISNKYELLNGALASFLCVGFGIYAILSNSSAMPLWQHIAGFIVSPAIACFGGYIRMKTKRTD